MKKAFLIFTRLLLHQPTPKEQVESFQVTTLSLSELVKQNKSVDYKKDFLEKN